MKINSYYLKARLFPTALTSIPALILYNKFVAPIYSDKLEGIYDVLPAITNVTFSAAIVFLLVQINRFLSKEIFQRLYFKDEIYMPTTSMLLKSNNEIESSIKQNIETKIKDKFNITLLNSSEEFGDELRARKLVATAVSQIRNVLRENTMLLQHNIEYGFFRNLIGGSFLALLLSIAIILFSNSICDFSLKNLGWILVIIYSLPIILSKIIINRYGHYYAKILYEQFLTL